ncbi:MAG: hypothetical protein CMP20_12375 [Rickettsiales bacterium]|nr:hypothetical protein [Rickettsiales bacterium]
MKGFYTFWKWAGFLATIALYLKVVSLNGGDYLGTALWFIPLLLVIEFGCFASRDESHEFGRRKV